jgi:glycosyltransferase involved in cell wall biosynthesis
MKASVIIPAYNAEKTIGQCLEALENQSFRDFETIVVDDGSKDKTAEIVEKFKGVKLLQQKNSGPAAARNLGAKNAKCEIIVFTDSDCIAEKNFLNEILAPFSDKKVAGVQGKYKSRQKELVARLTQLEIEQRHEKMARQESIDFMGSYAAAYKKSVFDEMTGFDTSFPMASGEDTDLSFRIAKAGYKMVFAEKAIVWHTHPSSLWKYLRIKFFRAFWRTKLYGKHREKMVADSYTSNALKVQIIGFILVLTGIVLGYFIYPFWFWIILLEGVVIATAILFVLSSMPFISWAWKKDLKVAVLFPLFAFCRTIFFALGLVLGTIRQVRNSI